MSQHDERILEALERFTGASVEVRGTSPLSGGDINEARRLDTSAGEFFVKTQSDASGRWFSAEARSLELLEEASTILRIPRVLGYADPEPDRAGFLLLEYIPRGRPAADYEQKIAEGLAELHRANAEAFGFDFDTYCGTTLQPNPRSPDWTPFYVEHRILHQARLMVESRRIAPRESRVFDRLATRMDTLLTSDASPSLIHGDLWSGNHLADGEGRPVLIDPAAYHAHPEAELGMMHLFGGFSQKLYETYASAARLEPGWDERMPLYELYHVMNHATLFGGGYADQALRIARRYAG